MKRNPKEMKSGQSGMQNDLKEMQNNHMHKIEKRTQRYLYNHKKLKKHTKKKQKKEGKRSATTTKK